MKMGPLKSEAQGLDLSVNIVCDEFLRAFGCFNIACFAAMLRLFFATFSWPQSWMQCRLFTDMGLGDAIGVNMGGHSVELS
jgi:hypothetical protein